jgi:hypothetical protein
VKELPITRERIRLPWPRVGIAVLGLTFLSSLACASEYCTKEQYERDRALITNAFTTGMMVKGPQGLRDSILVQEDQWFAMNYPKQIAFMQSFDCAMGGADGKHLLYMDVRSLATGNLLATWMLGVLKPEVMRPAQEPHDVTNPGTSEVMGDENRIGLTGQARADFIKLAVDACNSGNSAPPTLCSCYANAMADSVSMKELKETSALGNQEAVTIALRPKMEAAANRCRTN